ncbi:MAG TPA: hypothetical protein VF105_00800 [Gemmatimonadaceae bacterium]
MANVLILAREEVVAALLGLMVELRGMQPKFLGEDESVADAVKRERPSPVLIDCDHPDCTEDIIAMIRKTGGDPVLFSPYRMQSEVTRLASRYGVKSFTLPTDPDTFARLLKSELSR